MNDVQNRRILALLNMLYYALETEQPAIYVTNILFWFCQ